MGGCLLLSSHVFAHFSIGEHDTAHCYPKFSLHFSNKPQFKVGIFWDSYSYISEADTDQQNTVNGIFTFPSVDPPARNMDVMLFDLAAMG